MQLELITDVITNEKNIEKTFDRLAKGILRHAYGAFILFAREQSD